MALIDTHSTMTLEEFEALSGHRSAKEVVLEYTMTNDGLALCEPPYAITVTCSLEVEDGVARTMGKLLDSRGWSAAIKRTVRRRRNG